VSQNLTNKIELKTSIFKLLKNHIVPTYNQLNNFAYLLI